MINSSQQVRNFDTFNYWNLKLILCVIYEWSPSHVAQNCRICLIWTQIQWNLVHQRKKTIFFAARFLRHVSLFKNAKLTINWFSRNPIQSQIIEKLVVLQNVALVVRWFNTS